MKEKIIIRLLSWQCKNGLVKSENYNLYKYAYGVLLRKIFIYIIFTITTLVINNVIEMSTLLIAFIMLRQYTGGFHLKKESSCIALSSMTIISCSIYLASDPPITKSKIFLWVVAIIIIILLSPVESDKKKLDKLEIKIYRIRSYFVLIIEILIAVLLCHIKGPLILQSILLVHMLVSIGLVVSYFNKIFHITKI